LGLGIAPDHTSQPTHHKSIPSSGQTSTHGSRPACAPSLSALFPAPFYSSRRTCNGLNPRMR
jgi:hypothetical protein